MDLQFQSNNEEVGSEREMEYDFFLEPEMPPSLQMANLFDDAQVDDTDEPVVYESSVHDANHLDVYDDKRSDDIYGDFSDYASQEEMPSELHDHVPEKDSTFRLTVIERTLGELQKYIGELLVLVRQELESVQGKSLSMSDELPPLPDIDDYQWEAQADQYDVLSLCDIEIDREPQTHEGLDNDQGAVVYTGIFTGESMTTNDGKEFPVPENYASKSCLVHGDALKLTISPQGTMKYKQIGPVRRRRITGMLEHDPVTEQYSVRCSQGRFRVLSASVYFYKGVPGDEVLLIIPVGGPYTWAAIQSILKEL